MNKIEYITKQLDKNGIQYSPTAPAMLEQYSEMLVERNKHVNLTAITDFEGVVLKHFVDSLAPFSKNVSRETFEGSSSISEKISGDDVSCETSKDEIGEENVSRETFKAGVRVVDVGTGAGFPGLPIKIARPEVHVTLVDALRKRVDFLEDVENELGLTDIDIIHARAEDAARDEALRESFDICVSRAVADLRILSEYCLPFVRPGGIFIAYKAYDCMEEVTAAQAAIETLGGAVIATERVKLAEADIKRRLVIVKKISPTPDKYPRRAGMPEKKPLS